MTLRTQVAYILAFFAPFALQPLFALIGHNVALWIGVPEYYLSYYLAILTTVGVGVIGLCLAIETRWRKITAIIIYVPCIYTILSGYTLLFVCFVYGECV